MFGRQLGGGAVTEAFARRVSERRERASQHRRVRREHRADARYARLEIQQSRRRHPLVRVNDRASVRRRQELLAVAFDHLPGRPAEQYWFDVVPRARQRVDLGRLPQAGEDVVFVLVELRELDQHRARSAGRAPTTEPHRDSAGAARFDEVFEAWLGIEWHVGVRLGQQPRPDRDVVVAEALHRFPRFGRQNRVDAADLVADFPTDFEQERGGQLSRFSSRCADFVDARSRRCSRSSRMYMNRTNASCGPR